MRRLDFQKISYPISSIVCLIIIMVLASHLAIAQVNKGVLGFDTDADTGYVRLRGNLDNTIVFIGAVGDTGTDRDLGLLQLRQDMANDSETRAQLYLPSGRGQLQLDDSSNDLRVRLSAALREHGPSSNQSYGYLDLMGGSSEGASIAWLGGLNSSPLRGGLYLREANGTSYETKASLYLPDGRGQLQLDDSANDLRVRLSASNKGSAQYSYGYLDLMAGNTDDGRSIAWLGASDTDPRYGKLQLYDATKSEAETRITLALPSGRGQMILDDAANQQRVLLSSSLNNYGSGNNQSYGYLDLKAGTNTGNSIVYAGASNNSPDRGLVSVRDASDGKARVQASVASDHAGTLEVRDSEADIRQILLDATSEGGEIKLRSASGLLTGSLSSEIENGAECGVLVVGNASSGNLYSIDSCTGEKTAVYKHPTSAGKSIYYNALEGAEIGLYTRGRVKLIKGIATVDLPEHFSAIVSREGLTAQLTPHSAKSQGLAIVDLTPKQLKIAELGGGRADANYEVSFLVQGVKSGKEKFAAVRNATTTMLTKSVRDTSIVKDVDINLQNLEKDREKIKPEQERFELDVTPRVIEVEKRNDMIDVKPVNKKNNPQEH